MSLNTKKVTKAKWIDEVLTKVNRAKKRGKLERATKLYAVRASYDQKNVSLLLFWPMDLLFHFHLNWLRDWHESLRSLYRL